MNRGARTIGLGCLAWALLWTGCDGSGGPFWPGAYTCTTQLPSGYHDPGQPCQACHVPGQSGSAFPFIYSGTIYQSDGITPVPNIEVAVRDGVSFYPACSTKNGNFWVDGFAKVNWAGATIRVRNAAGTEKSPTTVVSRNPECNGCHDGTSPLKAP